MQQVRNLADCVKICTCRYVPFFCMAVRSERNAFTRNLNDFSAPTKFVCLVSPRRRCTLSAPAVLFFFFFFSVFFSVFGVFQPEESGLRPVCHMHIRLVLVLSDHQGRRHVDAITCQKWSFNSGQHFDTARRGIGHCGLLRPVRVFILGCQVTRTGKCVV
jgi:hypothetical protein